MHEVTTKPIEPSITPPPVSPVFDPRIFVRSDDDDQPDGRSEGQAVENETKNDAVTASESGGKDASIAEVSLDNLFDIHAGELSTFLKIVLTQCESEGQHNVCHEEPHRDMLKIFSISCYSDKFRNRKDYFCGPVNPAIGHENYK